MCRSHAGMGPSDIEAMREAMHAAGEGKLFAFCRSGNRSTLAWAVAKSEDGVPREELNRWPMKPGSTWGRSRICSGTSASARKDCCGLVKLFVEHHQANADQPAAAEKAIGFGVENDRVDAFGLQRQAGEISFDPRAVSAPARPGSRRRAADREAVDQQASAGRRRPGPTGRPCRRCRRLRPAPCRCRCP